MNNPKLTNILLIGLIVCNVLFFAGFSMSRSHHHHHRFDSSYGFRGRLHGSFGRLHRGFEASRGKYGGFHGSFRDHGWREQEQCGCMRG